MPREYNSAVKTFLSYLPNPKIIPDGVILILGSQTYELEKLSTELKTEAKKGERNIIISRLNRKSTFNYIRQHNINITLSEDQREQIFYKSKGHPLYLSYLLEKVSISDDIKHTLENFDVIDGDIDEYYEKIWSGIRDYEELVKFLGNLSRVESKINPNFITEWNIDYTTKNIFKNHAKHLFDESVNRWAFFHNSFRQFLIDKTAIEPLTGEFSEDIDKSYHSDLINYYSKSKVEPYWRKFYHYYRAGLYDEFLKEVSPDEFIKEYEEFRPVEEITRDLKLAMKIVKSKEDPYLLIRFWFCISEFENRSTAFEPHSFIKEFLLINKSQVAKHFLRSDNKLLCSKEMALYSARLFYNNNDKVEAKLLFSLAEPEEIKGDKILLRKDHADNELFRVIQEWIKVAPYFYPIQKTVEIIKNIDFEENTSEFSDEDYKDELMVSLVYYLCINLLNSERWDDIEFIMKSFETLISDRIRVILFDRTINKLVEIGNVYKADYFLNLLLEKFSKNEIDNNLKINIANLILIIKDDQEMVKSWLEDVKQPEVQDSNDIGYEDTINMFKPRIRLNKILNLIGEGLSITKAVKDSDNPEDYIIVEFERMLCITTQIYCEGIKQIHSLDKLSIRIKPIIEFYYKSVHHNNRYWHKLVRKKKYYFDYLILSVSKLGSDQLDELGNYILKEFKSNSSFWSTNNKRDVLLSLYKYGLDYKIVRKNLEILQDGIFKGIDVSERIEQCHKQAKAWLQLGDNANGEIWILRAFKESGGLGYNENYHFDYWIDWLNKVNDTDLENTKKRISWFVSHIEHINNTTEKGYLISTEILKTTLDWNFNNGLDLYNWLLNKELVNFEDGLEIVLIKGLIKSNIYEYYLQVEIFLEIYLFITKNSGINVLKEILKRGIKILKGNEFQIYLQRIVDVININALEEKRAGCFIEIKEFIEKHNVELNLTDLISLTISEKKPDKQYYNEIKLKVANEKLREDDVFKRISSYKEFKEIYLLEDQEKSYFTWNNIIDNLIES